jgi:carbon storage regulator CsrA
LNLDLAFIFLPSGKIFVRPKQDASMLTSAHCEPLNLTRTNTNLAQSASKKNPAASGTHGVAQYAQPRLSCELQNGIPMVRGASSSYYIFNQNGQRLLILTRKRNESIIIDNTIDVVVLEVNGNEVKLGIICPDDTLVRCEDNRNIGGTALRPR